MQPESPFVTIFEAPRATIRRIVDHDPGRNVNALLFGGGVVSSLQSVTSSPPATDLPAVLVAALACGAGLVSLLLGRVWAVYQRWVGSLLGGVASRAEVLAAYAWGTVPTTVVATIVVVTRFAVFGRDVLRVEQPRVAEMPLLPTTLGLATLVAALWAACVMVATYAEVNRFSIGRSVAAGLLGSAIAFVVLVLPLTALMFWLAPPGDTGG